MGVAFVIGIAVFLNATVLLLQFIYLNRCRVMNHIVTLLVEFIITDFAVFQLSLTN